MTSLSTKLAAPASGVAPAGGGYAAPTRRGAPQCRSDHRTPGPGPQPSPCGLLRAINIWNGVQPPLHHAHDVLDRGVQFSRSTEVQVASRRGSRLVVLHRSAPGFETPHHVHHLRDQVLHGSVLGTGYRKAQKGLLEPHTLHRLVYSLPRFISPASCRYRSGAALPYLVAPHAVGVPHGAPHLFYAAEEGGVCLTLMLPARVEPLSAHLHTNRLKSSACLRPSPQPADRSTECCCGGPDHRSLNLRIHPAPIRSTGRCTPDRPAHPRTPDPGPGCPRD